MEYIIIGLLVLIVGLIIILILKNKKEDNLTERIGRLETNLIKEIGEFKYSFSKNINEDFEKLNKKIEDRLMLINEKVNERLDQNFEKTNKTFTSILERLSKIDEAQKKIEELSGDIVSLQSVLTDKKTRGIYGEVNLTYILANVFGDKNDKIYQMQYTLNNGTIADAILFAPEPLGTICIDSKFPLENYQKMLDKALSKGEREIATKFLKVMLKSILMRLVPSILFLV
jgi:DNA recombination protein RmuC